MPNIEKIISPGLWAALAERVRLTHEPLAHVVSRALADYLGVSHHTLYQVSTSTALVEGVYQGAVRIGTLSEYGNLGLGTFEDLDGEMVALDGHFFQVRCDGSVTECDDAALAPFAVVTNFRADQSVILDTCPNLQALTVRFDNLRQTDNLFFALRVDGHFDYVKTRAMCKTKEGTPLVEAAATQPEFEFRNLQGTLVGFWTPEYAAKLSVPGYHFHFLSLDRKKGGHLLQCSGELLRLQAQRECDVHLALPETKDFLMADLRKDFAVALDKAERQKT